jgi:hypothetical protein
MFVLHHRVKEKLMKFKAPYIPDVRIRLTDDLSGFVCLVQRGWLYGTSDEFKIGPHQSLEPTDGVSELARVPNRRAFRNP